MLLCLLEKLIGKVLIGSTFAKGGLRERIDTCFYTRAIVLCTHCNKIFYLKSQSSVCGFLADRLNFQAEIF